MYKTREQINKDYDGQWIFMINCTKNKYHSISGGEVVVHNKNRSVVLEKMDTYMDDDSMLYFGFAGNPPEGLHLL